MRPRKLDSECEELLEMMFSKIKSDMKDRSNQFQVASKLISDFRREEMDYDKDSCDVGKQLDVDRRRRDQLESLAKYFGLPRHVFTNGFYGDLYWYLQVATPAAVVQMVKRFRYKTQKL